jgi:2-keto-4-pentenoate hydratase/2-oxohepta-3-ene-1,7-dioic acid hydratase (catechol pathway)
MQFFRFGAPGNERPAVRHGDAAFDLTPLTRDIDGDFLAADGLDRARDAVRAGELPQLSGELGPLASPIARPQAIACIGMNYAAHAAESGAAPPTVPIIFYKHPATIVGPEDDVVIPPGATAVDWEVELAIVMKRTPPCLESADEALAYIAGYTIANDVSERDWQLKDSGGQWSKGKSARTFNPLGPWLVPADELDAGALRLRSWVNGEVRQDSSTSDLIFSVGEIVAHLSRYVHLAPGDVINTGTPEGVALSGRFPYLRAGDVMELEIEGLGRQRQRLVAER